MVRFRVVRGSHLLLALSAVILAAVVVFILVQSTAGESGSIEMLRVEAKAVSAFASNPSTETSLQIEVLADERDAPPLSGAPCILIYHTHTHEAYEQTAGRPYEALEAWRTDDEQHSVVRVGAALADELSRLGNFVMHDTTDHEQENIDLAYVRSLETLESYSLNFDLVIDLHRDAYAEGMQINMQDGTSTCAQIMLLIGNGANYANEEAPDYEGNLAFAHRLTSELNRNKNGIARNVTVKNGRYNQHIGDTSVLIEVGHNKNTLEEALNSVPILAKSIDSVLKENHQLP